jgi:hypothetical protein
VAEDDFALGVMMAKETLGYEARELIIELMSLDDINGVGLAARMRVAPSYVSMMLNGKLNMSLGFLVKALYALGHQVHLEVTELCWPG